MNLKELKGKIIKRLKEFLSLINAHKVKSLFLLFLVVGIIWLILKYQTTACWMYGSSDEANGKLMTLIISVIGGFCVLWGLELNSRRVKEQTRQNDIAVQNNNDKRFGEAIGYMNSDNDGIVTGGIYALYQLAKEDKRYAQIVANIFVDYVNSQKGEKGTAIILDLIFSEEKNGSIWGTYTFNLRNVALRDRIYYCNNYNFNFFDCSFEKINIVGENSAYFNRCYFNNDGILGFKSVSMLVCNIENSNIFGRKDVKTKIEIEKGKIININMDFDSIGWINISPKYLKDVYVYANEISCVKLANFEMNEFSFLRIVAKKIDKIINHKEEKTTGTIIIEEKKE